LPLTLHLLAEVTSTSTKLPMRPSWGSSST
jgi:hypothetical protein